MALRYSSAFLSQFRLFSSHFIISEESSFSSHLLCFIESYRSDENSCESHWHLLRNFTRPLEQTLFFSNFFSVVQKITFLASWVQEIFFTIKITPKWICGRLVEILFDFELMLNCFLPLSAEILNFFTPARHFSPYENTVSNEINKTAIKIAETRMANERGSKSFRSVAPKRLKANTTTGTLSSRSFASTLVDIQ